MVYAALVGVRAGDVTEGTGTGETGNVPAGGVPVSERGVEGVVGGVAVGGVDDVANLHRPSSSTHCILGLPV